MMDLDEEEEFPTLQLTSNSTDQMESGTPTNSVSDDADSGITSDVVNGHGDQNPGWTNSGLPKLSFQQVCIFFRKNANFSNSTGWPMKTLCISFYFILDQ